MQLNYFERHVRLASLHGKKQQQQNGVSTLTCDHHQSVFHFASSLLYHCLESYRKKLFFLKALWVWSGGLSPLQTMAYKILFKFISALPFLQGDNITNHWPTDTQLEVMRQLRLQATLFNSLSLTLHHWINIMPPMRVRHWGGVKRELGKILSHT